MPMACPGSKSSRIGPNNGVILPLANRYAVYKVASIKHDRTYVLLCSASGCHQRHTLTTVLCFERQHRFNICIHSCFADELTRIPKDVSVIPRFSKIYILGECGECKAGNHTGRLPHVGCFSDSATHAKSPLLQL